MNQMKTRFLLASAVLGFLVAPALRAQESDWRNLSQIKPGTKIQVVEQSLKTLSGKLVRVSEIDITLQVEGNEIVLPKDQVYRVSVNGKNRKRNALIGFGIGAAAGVGVGAAVKPIVGDAKVIPGLAAAYAGLGAGIGAVLPAGKSVYRAERPGEAAMRKPTQHQDSDVGR